LLVYEHALLCKKGLGCAKKGLVVQKHKPCKKCTASCADSFSFNFHYFEPANSGIDIISYKIDKKLNKYPKTNNLLRVKAR